MSKTTPEQNKALVLEAFDTLFNKRDYRAAERFWSPKVHPTQRAHSTRSRRIVRPDPLTAANTAL
jgi:primosomal protein N'